MTRVSSLEDVGVGGGDGGRVMEVVTRTRLLCRRGLCFGDFLRVIMVIPSRVAGRRFPRGRLVPGVVRDGWCNEGFEAWLGCVGREGGKRVGCGGDL